MPFVVVASSSSAESQLPGKKTIVDPFKTSSYLEFDIKASPLSGINLDVQNIFLMVQNIKQEGPPGVLQIWQEKGIKYLHPPSQIVKVIKSSFHQKQLLSKQEILKNLQSYKDTSQLEYYYTGHGHLNGDSPLKQKKILMQIEQHLNSCLDGIKNQIVLHSLLTVVIRKIRNRPDIIVSSCGEEQTSKDIKGLGGVLIWLRTHILSKESKEKRKEMCKILIEQKGMILGPYPNKAQYITMKICKDLFRLE